MLPNNLPRVFLSYARGDDESFVKQLYEDLTAKGFSVRWDRVSMPSRALTFLQEIREAITQRNFWLVLVLYRILKYSSYCNKRRNRKMTSHWIH